MVVLDVIHGVLKLPTSYRSNRIQSFRGMN